MVTTVLGVQLQLLLKSPRQQYCLWLCWHNKLNYTLILESIFQPRAKQQTCIQIVDTPSEEPVSLEYCRSSEVSLHLMGIKFKMAQRVKTCYTPYIN